MKKRLLWMAILLPALAMSCKDELADSIDNNMKDAESKVEKVVPNKSASTESNKRKDEDWNNSASH